MGTEEERAVRRAAYMKNYRALHREELNNYHKEWLANNPGKRKQYQENYWKRRLEKMSG